MVLGWSWRWLGLSLPPWNRDSTPWSRPRPNAPTAAAPASCRLAQNEKTLPPPAHRAWSTCTHGARVIMGVARTLFVTLEPRFDALEPLPPKLTNGHGACSLPGLLKVRRRRHRRPTARYARASMVLGWSWGWPGLFIPPWNCDPLPWSCPRPNSSTAVAPASCRFAQNEKTLPPPAHRAWSTCTHGARVVMGVARTLSLPPWNRDSTPWSRPRANSPTAAAPASCRLAQNERTLPPPAHRAWSTCTHGARVVLGVARTLLTTLELPSTALGPPSPKLTNGRGACWLPARSK